MNERLQLVRATLKMNQSNFAKTLGMGQSTLAMMEVGKREILERHIKTICSIFNVDEEWLRTGSGEMFVGTDESLVEELANEYKLEAFDKEILKIFLDFSPEQQQTLKKFAFSLVDTVLNNAELYREYRSEYISKNAMQFAARGGDTRNMEELVDDFDTLADKENLGVN